MKKKNVTKKWEKVLASGEKVQGNKPWEWLGKSNADSRLFPFEYYEEPCYDLITMTMRIF